VRRDEALPEAEQEEIDDLWVLHSFAVAQQRANPDASEKNGLRGTASPPGSIPCSEHAPMAASRYC
jgi:hypothetical protein